ncbi:MAG TPA: large conductance mechanosensitive channel protein MscL [Thermomicrobiales bacterium]
MLREFRQFLLRGNVIDLAVAVVIGAAFGAVVTSLVEDIITPLISAIISAPNFSNLDFTINEAVFTYGNFLNAIINFVLVAAAIFFFVVKPVNAVMSRMRRGEAPPDPTTRECPECLSMVPIAARRCMYCAQPLPPLESTPGQATAATS